MIVLCIFILFFSGLVLLQMRSYYALLFGIALLGNAINFSIFFGSGPEVGLFPFVLDEGALPTSNDPLPQALVLTAIVIGFALLGFLVALVKKVAVVVGPIDSKAMMREECDD